MKLPRLFAAGLACVAFTDPIHLSSLRADAVTDWNVTADAAIRASTPSPPLQARALAMVHAAIFDAVNGIVGKYESYLVRHPAPPGARVAAAAVQAAHDVLLGLFPAQAALLDAKLAESIDSIPGHQGKSQSIARGREWGARVAAEVLAWRETDGLTTPTPPYLGGSAPGQWRSIPNGAIPGALPAFAKVLPFTMVTPSQFRPSPPPSLDSVQYAADVNETKALGRDDSAVRTPEQTQLCLLWANVGPLEENTVVRSVVPAGYELVDTARLFALVNFAACDALIAGFDSKYHFGFWRPFHAIRLADIDGNPATVPDLTWTSLISAPNHPEYLSTHSTASGALLRVLELELGDDIPFTVSSPGLPGVTAHYDKFSDAAGEVGLSRIWGGIHFRTACETGRAVGESIAEQAVRNYLLPR